ncbi:MAG TPA: c-type cytochrome [Xanthobacteraceae bacterium]|nr:c-type cytochrome [Xanthobacteraceae bacterium]
MLLALSLVMLPGAAGAATLAPSGVAACSNCHPKAGEVGGDTALPPLTGRRASDIVSAMTAFRNGKRQATVMGRIAKGFSDSEIAAIAAWYAAQR